MKSSLTLLLASTALMAGPAFAQAQPDPSQSASGVVTMSKADFDRLMSRMDSMEAELATLKSAQADTAEKVKTASAPSAKISWKGAPVIEGDGWSFKPRLR